jgi:hypothetical protein
VFVYPAPTEVVKKGIEIECTYLLKDRVSTDNVEDIPLPRTMLDVIFRF